MGYITTGTANARTAPTLSRIVETDAATLNFVRTIMAEVRKMEHEAANRRESEDGGFAFRHAADTSRRFLARIVEAASDDVRAQLNEEGTWN
jgi:hypothetical protein